MTDENRPQPLPCRQCGKPVEPFWAVRERRWVRSPLHPDGTPEDCRGRDLAERERKSRGLARLALVGRLLPPRYADWSFDVATDGGIHVLRRLDHRYGRALDLAAAWDPASSLLLLGPVGSGKSVLAAATARRLIVRGVAGLLWRSESRLLNEVKAAFGDGKADPLKTAMNANFLLLDDLGAGASTDFDIATMEALLCHRYDQQLPVLMTSNLDFTAISEKYGERVQSRLWKMASGNVAELVGEDRRLT
jgi:DNA replication protein DnaC